MSMECSSCGTIAGKREVEYCDSCGAPRTRQDFDPFRLGRAWKVRHVDRRAKAVVRLGCLLVGAIVLLSSFVLFHGAWYFEAGHDDLLRIWMSRLLAPALLVIGGIFVLSAFRAPPIAPVIPLDRARNLRRKQAQL